MKAQMNYIESALNTQGLSYLTSPSGNIFIYKGDGPLPERHDIEIIFKKIDIHIDVLLWEPPHGALIKIL